MTLSRGSSAVKRGRRLVQPIYQSDPSGNLLGFAQAFDQRGAQQKGACQLGIFRGPAQLLVVARAHRKILLRQQALVTNGLRLRVANRGLAPLPLLTVEPLLARFSSH